MTQRLLPTLRITRVPLWLILSLALLLWPSAAVIATQDREPGFTGKLAAGTLTVEALPVVTSRLPKGALRVPMLTLRLKSSCDADISISSVTIRREGLGFRSDLTGVYLLLGPSRISPLQRVSSTDERVTLRTRKLTVPACEERTVSIAADFSRTAESGSEHRFTVTSAEDLATSAASIIGTFPLGTQQESAVTPKDRGQVTASFHPAEQATRTGRQLLQKFRLHLGGQDDHALLRLTLTNQATAHDADLRNLFLQAQGKRLTNIVPQLTGREGIFTFTLPYELRARKEYLFEIRGEVWRKAKTFDFALEEPGDVVTELLPARGR